MMDLEILQRFKEIDTSAYPDFDNYKRTLEMCLWILWVSKESLGIKKLTAEQIASIIRNVKEIAINKESIIRSFCKAGDKIYTYKKDGEVHYEIMKKGKEHLKSQVKEDYVRIYYLETNKPFTSKRLLSRKIFENLKGELRIVDPYCSERTLDVLANIKNKCVKFITRLENLREMDKNKFLRELKDFGKEYPNIEFRNYNLTDIHDRYIISSEFIIILGYSIKDLGSKESFAIKLNKESNNNIFDAVSEIFNRRWKKSNPIP